MKYMIATFHEDIHKGNVHNDHYILTIFMHNDYM